MTYLTTRFWLVHVSHADWSLTVLLGCPYEHHMLLNVYLGAAGKCPVQTNICVAFGKYPSFVLFFVKGSLYQYALKSSTTGQWSQYQKKSSVNIMATEEISLTL